MAAGRLACHAGSQTDAWRTLRILARLSWIQLFALTGSVCRATQNRRDGIVAESIADLASVGSVVGYRVLRRCVSLSNGERTLPGDHDRRGSERPESGFEAGACRIGRTRHRAH